MKTFLFEEKCDLLPLPYQELIDRLKLNENTTPMDFLFISVIYNILECGFVLCHEKYDEIDTFNFNLIVLKLLEDVPLEDFYKKNQHYYEVKVRLGAIGNPEVVVMSLPSHNSSSKYLVVNMYVKHPFILTSLCIKLSDWLGVKSNPYKFKDRGMFSILVKEKLAIPIKNSLVHYLNLKRAPALERLPHHILKKIASYLNEYEQKLLNKSLDPSSTSSDTSSVSSFS